MGERSDTALWRAALDAVDALDPIDASQRTARLARWAADDPELHARIQALLNPPSGTLGAALRFDGPAFEPTDLTGQCLGAYRFVRPIGSGGMGQVWLAERTDGRFDGVVAIKLLAASTHPALVERFRREGQLLGRLTHPNIARLLDAGALPSGQLCLVLEHVAGERIDRHCDAQRLTVEQRIALFREVCAAVAHAHANLVVHRDLKPSNILVGTDARVKLLDFGIAKLLAGEAGDAGTALTEFGGLAMTPEYAAPEQVSGGAITIATDIYALGVLLYTLLSGQRPYAASTGSPAELMRAIVETEPPRLAALDVTSAAAQRATTPARLQRQLRGDLDTIVAKAMKKAPAERYANVQALSDDLQRVLDHAPVSARPDSAGYRIRKFVRRHRFGAAAAALVLLAVGGASGVALRQASLARIEAHKASATKDFLLGVFEKNRVGVGDTVASQNTTARQMLEDGTAQLLADTQLPDTVRLELLGTLGELTSNLALTDSARRLRERALPLARALHGPTSAPYVRALVDIGTDDSQQAEVSTQALGDAISIIEKHGLQQIESYPVALEHLGINAHLAGKLPEAKEYLQRAADAFAAHHPRHSGRVGTLRWLGNTEAVLNRFDLAEAHYREALALAAHADAQRDSLLSGMHYALGDLYQRTGRYPEAVGELEQTYLGEQRSLGPRHDETAQTLAMLGRVQHQVGRVEEGRASLALAAEIGRESSSKQGSNATDRVNSALAMIAVDEGDVAAALTRTRTALQNIEPAGGIALPPRLLLRAEAELQNGEPAAAQASIRRAIALFDARVGPSATGARHARAVLGETLAQLDRPVEARAVFAEVLAAGPVAPGPKLPMLSWLHARAHTGIAATWLPDQPAEALRAARQALSLIDADTVVLRERVVYAQARLVEGRALHALGQAGPARAAISAAVARLAACQADASPRLAQARRQLAMLPAG